MINKIGPLLTFALLAAAHASFGQTDSLILSSGTTASNGTASLNLNLTSPAGNEPVDVQWTLTYPPGNVIGISVTAGPAATAVSKTLSCFPGSGTYTCVASGMNGAIIANGAVAFVDVTIAAGVSATSIGVSNAVGSSAAGNGIVVVPTGGVVTGVGAPVTPSALACAPASLGPYSSSTCTVTLNQAAPTGGSFVSLSNNNATLTAPSSVTVAAGSVSGTFSATTGSVSSTQGATITATLGGVSKSTTLSLTAASDLAIGEAATQSSTYTGTAGAGAAIDGNTDGRFWNHSVSSTNNDANAWWQVDLGASSTINTVIVWNRTDCCAGRLSDYWVFVSDTPFAAGDTPTTLQNRSGTWSSHQTTMPNPSIAIRTGGVQGRYVRVQLTGTNYLSLAEVQIFSQALTLATQSSTYPGNAGAAAAIDGDTDGNYWDGSVSHTNDDTNAWWQEDLGVSTTVNTITVWNRTDCCGSRLGDYWVFVSGTPFAASDTPATLQNRPGTWSSHQTTMPNPSTAISTGGVQGRYVRVQLTGTNYLALAEVQIQ